MNGKRHVNIVLGKAEQSLNDMYEALIRDAHQDIDFTFTVATTVPDFICLASDNGTDLALFIPPGNIAGDPAKPNMTPQESAVHIVQTIKARHPIPVIVIAAHPVAREALLAAGADYFLDIPARSAEIRSAVAASLAL